MNRNYDLGKYIVFGYLDPVGNCEFRSRSRCTLYLGTSFDIKGISIVCLYEDRYGLYSTELGVTAGCNRNSLRLHGRNQDGL